jgi:hypothetical protein
MALWATKGKVMKTGGGGAGAFAEPGGSARARGPALRERLQMSGIAVLVTSQAEPPADSGVE